MKSCWNPALQLAAVMAAVAALSACDQAAPPAPGMAREAAAPAAAPAPAPEQAAEKVAEQVADPALDKDELERRVGTYPNDGNTSFLEVGPLAERLKLLLGEDRFKVLLQNMDVASPLTRDGERFFVTGNRPHEGGTEMAAVVADPAQNAVRVWLATGGKAEVLQSPAGADVPWPQDVQTMIGNFDGQ